MVFTRSMQKAIENGKKWMEKGEKPLRFSGRVRRLKSACAVCEPQRKRDEQGKDSRFTIVMPKKYSRESVIESFKLLAKHQGLRWLFDQRIYQKAGFDAVILRLTVGARKTGIDTDNTVTTLKWLRKTEGLSYVFSVPGFRRCAFNAILRVLNRD